MEQTIFSPTKGRGFKKRFENQKRNRPYKIMDTTTAIIIILGVLVMSNVIYNLRLNDIEKRIDQIVDFLVTTKKSTPKI